MSRNYTLTEEIRKRLGWSRGLTKETDKRLINLSKAMLGHKVSMETRGKMGESKKGQNNPMWGRIGSLHPNWRKKQSKQTILKKKKALTGKKRAPRSKEWRHKLSIAHKGKKLSEQTKRKMTESHKGLLVGPKNPMWGKSISPETKLKISKALKGKFAGKNHPLWIDGRSYKPYGTNFRQQLKDLIRLRDNYKCQKCGCPEIEQTRRLSVHHIDYDKDNCLPSNLITLCQSCNIKVNKDRKKWIGYFRKKLKFTNNSKLSLHK